MYFKCHRVFLHTFDVFCDFLCNKSHWPRFVCLGGGQWILNNCNVFIEMRMRLHLWDLKSPRRMWIIAEKGGAPEINWMKTPIRCALTTTCSRLFLGYILSNVFSACEITFYFYVAICVLDTGGCVLTSSPVCELRAASESCKQLRVKVPDSQW